MRETLRGSEIDNETELHFSNFHMPKSAKQIENFFIIYGQIYKVINEHHFYSLKFENMQSWLRHTHPRGPKETKLALTPIILATFRGQAKQE